jgi:hypothetical protein
LFTLNQSKNRIRKNKGHSTHYAVAWTQKHQNMFYTQLTKFEKGDEFHSASVKTTEEAKQLVEDGFEYVCTRRINGIQKTKIAQPFKLYNRTLIQNSRILIQKGYMLLLLFSCNGECLR